VRAAARLRCLALLIGALGAGCGGAASDDAAPPARSWWEVARGAGVADAELEQRLRDALENETGVSSSWAELDARSMRGVLTFRSGIAESACAKALARITGVLGPEEEVTSGSFGAPLGTLVVDAGVDWRGETARALAEHVRTVPGVATARVEGEARARISVDLDALALGARAMAAGDVHAALAALPAESRDAAMLEDALVADGVRLGDVGTVSIELDKPELVRFDGAEAVVVHVEANAAATDETWAAVLALAREVPGATALPAAPIRRWLGLPPGLDVAERERRTNQASQALVGGGAVHVLVASSTTSFPRALPAPLGSEALELHLWGDVVNLEARVAGPDQYLGPALGGAVLHALTGAPPRELGSVAVTALGIDRWSERPEVLGAETRAEVDIAVNAARAARFGLDEATVLEQVRDEWTLDGGALVIRIGGATAELEDLAQRELLTASGDSLPLRSVAEVRSIEREVRALFVGCERAVFLVGGSAADLERARGLALPAGVQLVQCE
jgi:hypothetical protein